MFFDMPLNSDPLTTSTEGFDKKLAAAKGRSLTDFALWGGLVPGTSIRSNHCLSAASLGSRLSCATAAWMTSRHPTNKRCERDETHRATGPNTCGPRGESKKSRKRSRRPASGRTELGRVITWGRGPSRWNSRRLAGAGAGGRDQMRAAYRACQQRRGDRSHFGRAQKRSEREL